MLSPACIRSNALLISSSGMVCVIRSSILILPSIYQSTILGTSVRPRAPPKALPFHTRPVTSWNGRDRKRVVEGKSVSVRVDLGGRRDIKKKKDREKDNKDRNNYTK